MTNNTVSSPQVRVRRRTFVQFFLLFLLIIAFYFPSFEQLFSRWTEWDQDLSHGLPTIGLFLFLVWRSLPWPYRADSQVIRAGLIVLLGLASVMWFLFHKIHIGILAHVTILGILLLLLGSCYSLKTLRHLAVPCGVLIFVLPLWGMLNGPLVEISAAVVGKMARLSGMTLLMDGNNIFIPYGRLYIDDGCSGLRYFIIALLMAYLISHLNHYRLKQTVIAFGVAILLALLTNWIRIFLLVVIGYQTEMNSGLMEDHELFGWVLFALVMLPAIYYAPAYKSPAKDNAATVVARPVLPIIAMASGPLLSLLIHATPEAPPSYTLRALNALTLVNPAHPYVVLQYPELPLVQTTTVMKDDVAVRVELAQYVQADPQKKLVPYFRSLHNRDAWSVVNEWQDETTALRFSVLKRAGAEQYHLLVHLYQVGRYPTGHYEMAKLLQIPAMLLGDNYFAIFTAQAPCSDVSCSRQIIAVQQIGHHWLAAPSL